MANNLNSNGFGHQPYQENLDGPFQNNHHGDVPASSFGATQFDIFDWHPSYQSCQKYFLDHAQYENPVQAVAALINICLPYQWTPNPVVGSANQSPHNSSPSLQFTPFSRQTLGSSSNRRAMNWVSLHPYIRRLVITGFDSEAILHGFFGDDWRKGVGPVQECERRNYLFAAKSGGWAKVKNQYDMGPQETVPFLQPPQNVQLAEIENAEKEWSKWLAMEDWMVGPRAPEHMEEYARMSDPSRSQQ